MQNNLTDKEILRLQAECTNNLAKAVALNTEAIIRQTEALTRVHDAILIAVSTFANDIKSDKEAELRK